MTNHPQSHQDHVDAVLKDWKRERPYLDQSPTALLSRLGRLNNAVGKELESLLAQFNLTRTEYDVLATLRRKGPPFRQPLKTLLPSLMRTSGTVTFRLDRLEKKGLVRREADIDDRRSISVILTEAGETLFDRVQPLHLADGSKLLRALTDKEQTLFVELLKKMLLLAEAGELRGLTDLDVELLQCYGFHLSGDGGTNPTPGVTVQHVTPKGPADQAGVRKDDRVSHVNGKPVVATALVELLLHELDPDAPLQIAVQRNRNQHFFTIDRRTY